MYATFTWLHVLSPIIYHSSGTTSRIVEPPHDQTVPVNSVAKFTCRTTGLVVWIIDGAVSSLLSLRDGNETVNLFRMEGFTLDSENKSVLLVNATIRNNKTSIRCRTGPNRITAHETSEEVVFTVFGK